jgi:hypothetical protein
MPPAHPPERSEAVIVWEGAVLAKAQVHALVQVLQYKVMAQAAMQGPFFIGETRQCSRWAFSLHYRPMSNPACRP